jgi:hypothetical protein
VASREGAPLAHLLVRGRAEDRELRRSGGGDPKIRDVEFRAHGRALRRELESSIKAAEETRLGLDSSLQELRALGVVIVLEGADAAYPLKVESFERFSRHTKRAKQPLWLLLSVVPATDDAPERATVWVSDEYRTRFLRLFEDYLQKSTPNGHPKNRELVANVGRIRAAVLADLWQSDGTPPASGTWWWELWLAPSDEAVGLAARYAQARGLQLAERNLILPERTVIWVRCTWTELQELLFTAVPVTEIRRPELVETVEDLPRDEQDELAEDLLNRLQPTKDAHAPVVCHLDTGVRRTHALLTGSLAQADVHTIVAGVEDRQNHGTAMASLALLGPLDELLLSSVRVELRHRLESVKMLPDTIPGHDPDAYGLITAQAVALPEVSAVARRRVFCIPVTAEPDLSGGAPTLWSASLDALAAGVGIAAHPDGIALLGAPNPDAARLFVVSAGNVPASEFQADYLARCDLSSVEDPAHAWNALTVGAATELTAIPADPSFVGWAALAQAGDVSPHSRTSVMFSHRSWPVKPDICMEGGNVLTDGASDFLGDHPAVSLRTADAHDDLALSSANATSAATAQAARLAALAHATYPELWPESVRGLLVHGAEWTPLMRAAFNGASSKTERLALLRRYGWGVPTEQSVLNSSRQAVTMVTQDEFVPFVGEDHLSRRFRLHRLPWPVEVLRAISAADVTLKVTLSYFIEPTASRRGWRRRYSYPSHGLRFDLKAPTETVDDFVLRVNREARQEEDGGAPPSGATTRWLVGPNQRNLGSLHQDLWTGSGADLAESGVLAVHPIGGWWKYAKRKDRVDRPVRYALIVSLKTAEQNIDLYTPIAVQLELPIPVEIPAT